MIQKINYRQLKRYIRSERINKTVKQRKTYEQLNSQIKYQNTRYLKNPEVKRIFWEILKS